MCKLDRYLIREMLGPFLFGMGAFAVVLVGVFNLYEAMRMIMERGLPVGPVLLFSFYLLPQTIVMTLPMSVIFAVLMAFGGLSSHGEVTALRAGGVGLWRMSGPALLLGLAISIVSAFLYGWIIPYSNNASEAALAPYVSDSASKESHLLFKIPDKDHPQREVEADRFDPATETLYGVWIWEYRDGEAVTSYWAKTAQWKNQTWVLRDVRQAQMTRSGPLTKDVDEITFDIGKSPAEIAKAKTRLPDLTMAELKRLGQPPPGGDTQQARDAREELQMRLAVPWAALGLALIGVPLGIRPQRTSTGVGLAISLGVILVYYPVFNMMRILGQQGALPPMLSDWIPNLLLYTIGLGLLINSSR